MKREVREFEIFCKGCRTITYLDKKLPSGMYNLVIQKYGKTVIVRFAFDECPFCIFEEDLIFQGKKGVN
jgi:hypothetical protein